MAQLDESITAGQTAHISDHEQLAKQANNLYDVVADFGATGDGATDDTAAIQAAIDAAQISGAVQVIYFPPGDYIVSSTLTLPDSGNAPSLLGAGPSSSWLTWNATGGTLLAGGTAGNAYIRGLRFRAGSGKADIWFDNDADPAHDYGTWIEDCYFHDWNITTGIAAIRTGTVVNCHMRNLRFGGGKGFGIILKAGSLGSFTLDNFTLDTVAADGVFKGFINVHKIASGTVDMRLSSGRIENGLSDWANPSALIWIDSDPVNSLGVYPATVHIDNIDGAATSADPMAVVHQDTTQTGVGTPLLITSSVWSGDIICGGNWSAEVEKPARPSGMIGLMAVGRFNSGSPEDERTNWWMQNLVLGNYLGLKEGPDSEPAASGAGFTRFSADTNHLKTIFSDGTRLEIHAGTGTPEGAIAARVGSLFLRDDGAANTAFYVKELGTGSTGWAAK